MSARTRLLLLSLLLGGTSCSTQAPATRAPDAASPVGASDASTTGSPGCGTAPDGKGLRPKRTVISREKTREYFVSVSPDYDPGREHPVVLVFHGATDTRPEAMRDWFPVEKYAPPSIFVYPQALVRTRPDGTGGSVTRWDVDGEEDLAFVDALLEELGKAYCLRSGDAYATGFSSGGNFSQQLGCKRRAAVRAIAPVAGPGPFTKTCDAPLAVWMTHDTDDTSLPISGARTSRDFWIKANQCSGELLPVPQAECKRALGCPDDAPVVYCESSGVGHAVPGYAPRRIAEFFATWMVLR